MARVFVSHASADLLLAKEVGEWLADAHYEYFLDRDLRAGIALGEEWERRLHERLRWADVVVCLVTRSYVSSAWCSAEAGIARARGSRVLPIAAEPGVSHPLLVSLQHLDLDLGRKHVKRALVDSLRRADISGPSGWTDDRNPFPGLRPFEFNDSRVFFGRSQEVERLGELLRSPAEQAKEGLLIVVGPSGCGKSSLVKAGVAPAMANEDHWFVLPPMRPGATPLSELGRTLAEGFLALGRSTTVADVRNHLQTRGLVSLLDELRVVARRLDVRRILLIVDQLEELVTHAGAKETAQFAALLAPGMQGCLSVLATLRPDFLDAVLADPARAGLPLRRIFALRPLDRESVYSIIEGPAEVAGLKVDGKLTRRLIEDGGTGDALPLIAFTLSRLADGLHRGDELSMRRYEDLGGVRAALQKRADLALAAAVLVGGRSHKQVVRGLLQLVAVDREGAPTRMQIVVDQLPPPQRKEFDAFVAERLLTLSSVDDETRISVAHEAIFSVWPPLSEEIDQARAELRLRAIVEALAHDWEADGRHPSLLLHGPRLTEAQAFWGAGGSAVVNLSARARAFLQESHTRQVRTERQERLNTRLLRQVIAAGVFFVLVCIAIFIGARILILTQQDLNLLQRAHDAADTNLVDPQQLALTPTGAILASGTRVALLYDNGLAQSAGGASTAPPLGDEELAVAQGFAKSSVRTASGGGLTYRVVAVVAGEGRALVLGQNIQQALKTIWILGIALAVPALIGAALAVASAVTLSARPHSRPRPQQPA